MPRGYAEAHPAEFPLATAPGIPGVVARREAGVTPILAAAVEVPLQLRAVLLRSPRQWVEVPMSVSDWVSVASDASACF